MIRPFVLALLIFVAPTCFAQSGDEIDEILSADKTRWEHIKAVSETHDDPPHSWQVVEDSLVHIAASFPCTPQREIHNRSGQTILTYMCAVHHRGYLIEIQRKDLRDAKAEQTYLVGSDYGLVERLTQAGQKPALTPISKVTYQGALGREVRVVSEALEIERRMIIWKDLCIALQISDLPGQMPGDSSTFFRSLKFW